MCRPFQDVSIFVNGDQNPSIRAQTCSNPIGSPVTWFGETGKTPWFASASSEKRKNALEKF